MTHETAWYINRRVLVQTIAGDVDPGELQMIMREFGSYVALGDSSVHALVDVSGLSVPANLRIVERFCPTNWPEKLGWILVIGASPTLAFFMSMVMKVSSQRCQMFTSVTEALVFLRQQDKSLTEYASAAVG